MTARGWAAFWKSFLKRELADGSGGSYEWHVAWPGPSAPTEKPGRGKAGCGKNPRCFQTCVRPTDPLTHKQQQSQVLEMRAIQSDSCPVGREASAPFPGWLPALALAQPELRRGKAGGLLWHTRTSPLKIPVPTTHFQTLSLAQAKERKRTILESNNIAVSKQTIPRLKHWN